MKFLQTSGYLLTIEKCFHHKMSTDNIMSINNTNQIMDPSRDTEKGPAPSSANWKPSAHEILVIISLAIVSMMISIDATILITSLSVSYYLGHHEIDYCFTDF
jgi:hypothetical protein